MSVFKFVGKELELNVYAQPGGRKTEVLGLHGGALKIRLAAPPVDGAANDELVRFAAELFGVSRRDVALISGLSARSKRLRIACHPATAQAVLDGLLASSHKSDR